MDKRRFHQCYRSLRNDPRLDKEPRRPKRTASLNKMYLETKISMLEIIQDGLQLKLDMHCAKEEFLGILEGYNGYEDHLAQPFANEGMYTQTNNNTEVAYRVPPTRPTFHDEHQQFSGHENEGDEYNRQHLSSNKARVKALYEQRKARMQARRERLDTQPSTTSYAKPQNWEGLDYEDNHQGYGYQYNNYMDSAEAQRVAFSPDVSFTSQSDKENIYQAEDMRNNNTPTKSSNSSANYYEFPEVIGNDDHQYINMLSTITEENSSSSKNSSGNHAVSSVSDSDFEIPRIPPRCPLIPKDRYSDYLTRKTPPKPFEDLGEYVTLKAPNQSMVSFVESNSNMAPPPSMLQPNMTDAFGGSMFSLLECQSNLVSKKDCDNSMKESPFRYASSDAISELYTSSKREKSLLDISQISNISSSSSVSSAPNPPGLSDTTLGEQPMHSTMIGALTHSPVLPLSLSETEDDSLMNRTNETLESIDTLDGDVRPRDQRTTVSEPSGILRAPNSSKLSVHEPPRAYDDCYIAQHKDTSGIFKTPNNPIPRQKPRSGNSANQTQIPQLCKEHGLHLNYGGPCIFEDSFDLNSSDGSELDFSSVNFNSENGSKLDSKRSSLASKISSNRSSIVSKLSSVIHPNSAADTDYDSSYLSECVDDTHFTNDFSEAEHYTAVYDSHKARMRMLRRQTGQGNIKHRKQPVGLSESDFLHNVTERHLSLQGNRNSPPDMLAISPNSSNSSADLEEVNQSESTLIDSTLKSYYGQSSYKESDDGSLNGTVLSSNPRPGSMCTTVSTTTCATTDESPESNGAMTVPVNSPNITDSGGSSSRPTTDSYDYVDVPIDIPKVAQLLKNKLGSPHHFQQQQPVQSQQTRSLQSIPSNYPHNSKYAASSTGSHRSHRSHAPSAYSDPIPQFAAAQGKNMQRARKSLRYPHSQDSGFATHESAKSHQPRSYSLDPVHGAYTQHPVQPNQSHSEQFLARSCHKHRDHDRGHNNSRGHIVISDNQGVTRNVVQHNAVARHLNKERKKALAKKLKQFSNNFYNSSGNPQIRTLGHF